MKGRLLHSKTGELRSVLYDPILNNVTAESYTNVKVKFNHTLVDVDFRGEVIQLRNNDTMEVFEDTADLIIGADGAHSALRFAMLSTPMFQFSQTYIDHGYLELRISPGLGDKMTPNHLHIWPRGQFMMIALPNKDNSWTVTLFMPFKNFNSLGSEAKIIHFFENTFPDAIPLIGKEELLQTFLNTKPSQLISVKCNPYHCGSKFLIIGDAAHAMVPFYGQGKFHTNKIHLLEIKNTSSQIETTEDDHMKKRETLRHRRNYDKEVTFHSAGMNSGFEDCTILNELLEKNDLKMSEIIKLYSKIRVPNAQAICDLAMYNYLEMRDLVNRKSFRVRKTVDEAIFRLCPKTWIPLYNSVSFSNLDYSRCLRNKQSQDKVYNLLVGFFLLSLAFVIFNILN
nr:unnamed protein product [Callosobruchus analis]